LRKAVNHLLGDSADDELLVIATVASSVKSVNERTDHDSTAESILLEQNRAGSSARRSDGGPQPGGATATYQHVTVAMF
jgi:hypothetical protein